MIGEFFAYVGRNRWYGERRLLFVNLGEMGDVI
jgi:hypothetical protein